MGVRYVKDTQGFERCFSCRRTAFEHHAAGCPDAAAEQDSRRIADALERIADSLDALREPTPRATADAIEAAAVDWLRLHDGVDRNDVAASLREAAEDIRYAESNRPPKRAED